MSPTLQPVARWIAPLAALFLAAGCAGGDDAPDGGEARLARAELTGRIAFTLNRKGQTGLWIMAADGSARRRVVDIPLRSSSGFLSPAWSPDGSQLAYATHVGSTYDLDRSEIFVIGVDGSSRRRLTSNGAYDADPAWSADGKRIVFSRVTGFGEEGANGGLFVMYATGGGEKQLTRVAWPRYDRAPAWSPDGEQIVFERVTFGDVSEDAGRSELYVMSPDGGDERRIASGSEPSWSPDGTRIVYSSIEDGHGRTCFHECSTSREIHVVDADGSDDQRLTDSEADDHWPAWSPDGFFIAFTSDRSNPPKHENEIYVMRADGSGVRRITRNGVWDIEPAWAR
jgi:TolB protein